MSKDFVWSWALIAWLFSRHRNSWLYEKKKNRYFFPFESLKKAETEFQRNFREWKKVHRPVNFNRKIHHNYGHGMDVCIVDCSLWLLQLKWIINVIMLKLLEDSMQRSLKANFEHSYQIFMYKWMNKWRRLSSSFIGHFTFYILVSNANFLSPHKNVICKSFSHLSKMKFCIVQTVPYAYAWNENVCCEYIFLCNILTNGDQFIFWHCLNPAANQFLGRSFRNFDCNGCSFRFWTKYFITSLILICESMRTVLLPSTKIQNICSVLFKHSSSFTTHFNFMDIFFVFVSFVSFVLFNGNFTAE